mmetsp:Transcript_14258/g.39344  ORF Transcript_14258/g.39344 Transcript_14258/m.39344 type:complete len:273 (-) Transcript_14258:339-1157(-)
MPMRTAFRNTESPVTNSKAVLDTISTIRPGRSAASLSCETNELVVEWALDRLRPEARLEVDVKLLRFLLATDGMVIASRSPGPGRVQLGSVPSGEAASVCIPGNSSRNGGDAVKTSSDVGEPIDQTAQSAGVVSSSSAPGRCPCTQACDFTDGFGDSSTHDVTTIVGVFSEGFAVSSAAGTTLNDSTMSLVAATPGEVFALLRRRVGLLTFAEASCRESPTWLLRSCPRRLCGAEDALPQAGQYAPESASLSSAFGMASLKELTPALRSRAL